MERCDFRDGLGNRCTGVAGHGDTGREPHTFDLMVAVRARLRVIEAGRHLLRVWDDPGSSEAEAEREFRAALADLDAEEGRA